MLIKNKWFWFLFAAIVGKIPDDDACHQGATTSDVKVEGIG